jgi:hypothetical protein
MYISVCYVSYIVVVMFNCDTVSERRITERRIT